MIYYLLSQYVIKIMYRRFGMPHSVLVTVQWENYKHDNKGLSYTGIVIMQVRDIPGRVSIMGGDNCGRTDDH